MIFLLNNTVNILKMTDIINTLDNKLKDIYKYKNKYNNNNNKYIDNLYDYLDKELLVFNYNYYNNDKYRFTLNKLSDCMTIKNYNIEINLLINIIDKLYLINKHNNINLYDFQKKKEYFLKNLNNLLIALINNVNNINYNEINKCINTVINIISFYITNNEFLTIDLNNINEKSIFIKEKNFYKNVSILVELLLTKNNKFEKLEYNLINIYILFQHMLWVKNTFKTKNISYFKLVTLNNKIVLDDILYKITDEIIIYEIITKYNLTFLDNILKNLLTNLNINSFKLIYRLFYYKNTKFITNKNEFIKNSLIIFIENNNCDFEKNQENLSILLLFLKNLYNIEYINNEIMTDIHNYLSSKFKDNSAIDYIYLKNNYNGDNMDSLIKCLSYIHNKKCNIITIKKNIFINNNINDFTSNYCIYDDKIDSYSIIFDNLLYDKLKSKLQYKSFYYDEYYYYDFVKIFVFLKSINNLKFIDDNKNSIPLKAKIFMNLVKNHLKNSLCDNCNISKDVIPAYCLEHYLCFDCHIKYLNDTKCPSKVNNCFVK